MIGLIATRLAQAIFTLLVAVSLVFLAMRTLPGHPLLAKFGQHPDAEQIRKIREEQGWDRPLYQQLGDFLWQLTTTGDLGNSLARGHESVNRELWRRLSATIELAAAAAVIAIPLGLSAGLVAAYWRNRFPDVAVSAVSLVGVCVPVFFLGICLRGVFTSMPVGFRLPALVVDFEPWSGFYLVDTLAQGRFDLFLAALEHLCLPALTLSSIPMAYIARVTRTSLLEVSRGDFVRTARAKGASSLRVWLRHLLPNAAPPIVNIAGFQVGMLLSGAVLTESVFDWPGLGKYVVDAIHESDYTVVQAGALLIAAIFVGTNLLLDLLHLWLDPRVARGRGT